MRQGRSSSPQRTRSKPRRKSDGLRVRIKKWWKRKCSSFKRKTIRKIKKNKFKVAFSVVGLLAILIVIILHSMRSTPFEYGNFTHDARFKGYVISTGIDVSYAQGDNIDWHKVKKSGVDFVYIRAGFRDASKGNLHKDAKFEQNIKGASDAGLMVGVYLYSQATTTKEAAAEADYLADLADKYRIDLPIVMDYELYNGGRLANAISSGSLGTAVINRNALAFAKRGWTRGYETMIYGNYDFLMHYASGFELSKSTNIWLAQYNTIATYKGNYMMWQSTDKATVPGINKNVDLNFMYLNPKETYHSLRFNANGKRSIEKCNVQLKSHSSRYLGFAVKPGIVVYDHGKELSEGKDYKVAYIKNTSPGTGYAIVTGIGKYRDSVMTSFKVKKLL
ncbi:glycoside hydrolase family 25 protein [Mogibacterium neglectum]|uniref:glycoside hydrolase family 25 protein n=1 Tax=Mogibacterium neglectum TaxID=114528 RepID=UPI002729A80A|nr:glycoside hydrolase family 25 protein [Mogibacterium neglectum]WLD76644.1 glycoside hydrolase family 25 protein [Mogibacterium neglectum]